jgi:hypothetical protein
MFHSLYVAECDLLPMNLKDRGQLKLQEPIELLALLKLCFSKFIFSQFYKIIRHVLDM